MLDQREIPIVANGKTARVPFSRQTAVWSGESLAETETKTAPDWNVCLRRIRDAQDQSSFIALFRHFAPRVKNYLIRCGGTPDQAEEAMQEAMATVWRKADLFDPSKALSLIHI